MTTGEKVVTEVSQQGALQASCQHKETDITTGHFIYLGNFYNGEKETKSQNIYNSDLKKKAIVSKRTSHHAPLWGVALEESGI